MCVATCWRHIPVLKHMFLFPAALKLVMVETSVLFEVSHLDNRFFYIQWHRYDFVNSSCWVDRFKSVQTKRQPFPACVFQGWWPIHEDAPEILVENEQYWLVQVGFVQVQWVSRSRETTVLVVQLRVLGMLLNGMWLFPKAEVTNWSSSITKNLFAKI